MALLKLTARTILLIVALLLPIIAGVLVAGRGSAYQGAIVFLRQSRLAAMDVERRVAFTFNEVRETSFSNIVCSPSGRSVALRFARDFFADPIYLIEAGGNNFRLLPESQGYAFSRIAFSPDDGWLSFESAPRGSPNEIYVIQRDGNHLRQLTNVEGPASSASWSPDGRQLVFVVNEGAFGGKEIYVVDADGSSPRRLTENTWDEDVPRWLAGGRLAFISNERPLNSDIVITDAAAGSPRRVTAHERGDILSLEPSPDGTRLLYLWFFNGQSAIYVMNADGSQQQRLVEQNGNALTLYNPTWSPDGRQIAFIDDNDTFYLLDVDSENPPQPVASLRDSSFCWLP